MSRISSLEAKKNSPTVDLHAALGQCCKKNFRITDEKIVISTILKPT